jgi:hypothetical protein
MSLPPLPSHTPDAPDNRPAEIARRSARLRAIGVAGAVATLGVFTGLAASHQPAGGSGSGQGAIEAPSADGATSPEETGGAVDFFFPEDAQSSIAPAGQDSPAAMSGGS